MSAINTLTAFGVNRQTKFLPKAQLYFEMFSKHAVQVN